MRDGGYHNTSNTWIQHNNSASHKFEIRFFLLPVLLQDIKLLYGVLLRREFLVPFQYTAVNYINVQLIVEINHQAVLSDEHHDLHEHRLTPGSCFGRLRK